MGFAAHDIGKGEGVSRKQSRPLQSIEFKKRLTGELRMVPKDSRSNQKAVVIQRKVTPRKGKY